MAKILVVEDNDFNREILVRRLQRKGFEVVVAVDGQAGVDAARSERPDLILMDMSLPVMDGWESTRLLRAAPDTEGIPVIAVTAHAMPADRTNALAAGCDDYISKPIEMEILLDKMTRLLEQGA